MLIYIEKMKYAILISIIFMSLSYGKSCDSKKSSIIFYCENTAENPWNEYSPAFCKFPFLNAVLGNLTFIDSNANILPSSLESIDFDFQKNTYMLTLKKNLKFHNNRMVTARDLEFSIVRYFFAKNTNPGSMMLTNIKGIKSIKYGQPYKPDLVKGVKVLNDRTVAIALLNPNPSFLYTIARFGSLVPKEELKEDLLTWKKWPIGTGAYKIIFEDKKKRTISLSLVNAKEHPKAPKEIIFEQSRTYEPDLTINDGIILKDKKYTQEALHAPLGIGIIEFNYSLKLSNDINFRKAVSLAFSRKKISGVTIIKTEELHEMIPKGHIGRSDINEEQNANKSNKLLKKALKGHNDKTYLIPFCENKSFLGSEYRKIIKEQLENVGLKVEFKPSKNLWNPFSKNLKNSPFRLCTKVSNDFDPIFAFIYYKNGPNPLKNISPHDNTLNNLIVIAGNAPSRNILNANLKEITNYIYKNTISVPLFVIPTIAFYKPKKIKSIGNQFGGILFYLHNIEIK